jgi:4-amino-4-deoxy-L-arabinose transferase-like glycosyltransferase
LRRNWLLLFLLAIVYIYGLNRAGMLGPDEPRYAAIGLEMSRSGDWITPRLWGEAWFEKPPLLYWLVGAGDMVGLPEGWAARLPVAMLSIAFLAFFFRELRREWEGEVALVAARHLGGVAGFFADRGDRSADVGGSVRGDSAGPARGVHAPEGDGLGAPAGAGGAG